MTLPTPPMRSALERVIAEFERRKSKNARYSLRAFAKTLGVHPATLSALFSGNRPLTASNANRLLKAIGVTSLERQELVDQHLDPGANTAQAAFEQMNHDALQTISSWEYFAILSLLELEQARSTPQWISKRLGIPQGHAREALQRLRRLELVEKKNGRLVPSGKQLTIGGSDTNLAVRRVNRQYIEMALDTLNDSDLEERDISGITMAIHQSRLPEAKRLIRDFRRKLCAFLEEGKERDALYRINIQLFPLRKKTARRPPFRAP